MVRRLLIANRGEIAIRIARAARERGIAALGVYSEADVHALHRRAMDESVCIGPAPARESYLDAARIVAAGKALGADAVHPGYGFLSEQAAFAEAVTGAGMRFVGPSAATLAAVGSKIEARRRAQQLGIPVVPGYDGDDRTARRLRTEAKRIGLPLLIKASAGGGGRGMRVVNAFDDFEGALDAAQREARAAFGDDAVLLERYVTDPRHIEVQVLGDRHGHLVHLGERECSVQRRHQKLIEEAPSPAVDDDLRAQLTDAALRFARAVDYENAGTVEFLLDERRFYFLEMNARLQVEHAVTEMVYGVDLVGLQLDVAAGDVLPIAQQDLQPRGWAVEARIYAEDPARDYLPATGTIGVWDIPLAPGTRVDAGVERGSEISIHYDGLLAKVIAHSFEREPAIARLSTVLRDAHIEGVETNLALLSDILDDEAFRAGTLSTGFIAERGLLERARTVSDDAIVQSAAFFLQSGRPWRAAGTGVPLRLDAAGRIVRLTASRSGDTWAIGGDLLGTWDVNQTARRDPRVSLAAPPELETVAAARAHAGTIAAPMPGKITSVAVHAGGTVAANALLLVLEAMKMEHRIEAPLAGIVREIFVEPGQLVAAGAPLVRLE
jgi:3-methylcrotonyl-CoA carboxylase alpha subunit